MANTKQPTYVPDPVNQPQVEGQVMSFRPGSKLAVLGVFVVAIRERFSADTVEASFPWRWLPKISETKLAIESAFNEDQEHRNKRPGIFIDTDEQVTGRTVLGDRAGQNLKTGMVGFFGLQSVPILIECVASKRAESAVIADLVGSFLQASSDLIQAKFGFHDMTPVTVGRTQPYGRDKNEWITPVTFTTQYPSRWTNTPTGALLQRIEAQITASGADSATEFFELIALSTSMPET
jgi:hypothetical protein